MRNVRENFLISGIVLIVSGAILSISVNILMGAISSMGLSAEGVAAWQPSLERLPDAGRFMYRVDVTLDEPIKSTILCGPCGHLETVDGSKPKSFTCSNCGAILWAEEE